MGQINPIIELLAQASVTRADVFIANVVKCRPPGNRDPQSEELSACDEHLEALLDLATPRSLDAYSSKRQFMRYAGWWWFHDRERRKLPEDLVSLLDKQGVPSQWRQV